MSYYIGVDLGGTNIKAGLFTSEGKLLKHITKKLESLEADNVVLLIVGVIQDILLEGNITTKDVKGIGLVLPGLLDCENGIVIAVANFPTFNNYPLISKVHHLTNIPVFMENDARGAVAAELWVGAGSSLQTIAMFTLGTGVGFGIIIDGKILHGGKGFSGYAPEAGHTIVQPGGRLCGCGQNGCLEQYASATSVVISAKELLACNEIESSMRKFESEISCKNVVDCAKEGDTLALQVVHSTARYVAIGCLNICRIFEPEVILLTGGMTEAGDFFFGIVQNEFNKVHWRISKPRRLIQPATVGNHAGVTGAAYIGFNSISELLLSKLR